MNDILPPLRENKLYEESSIQIATFLGGPIAGGYLIAENFKSLGQINKVRTTWIFASLLTFIVLGLPLLISVVDKIPVYVFHIIFTVISSYVLINYQSEFIREHIDNGGKVYSIWRAIFIALMGVCIWHIVISLLVLLEYRRTEIFLQPT